MNLSDKTNNKIERLLNLYPERLSAMLPILHLIQEEEGWISDEAMEWVAERLEIETIKVYEVVTFYPMFRRSKVGEKHIKVCRTLSCALRGSYKTCEKLAAALNCPEGETTADGKYTLEFVECIADCGPAPVVQVNECLYEGITPDKVDGFVASLRDGSIGGAAEASAASGKDSADFKG